MTEPIGSKQYRSVVVRDESNNQWRIPLLVAAAVLLIAISYWLGARGLLGSNAELSGQLQDARQQLEQRSARIDELEQKLANLQLGADIDQQAVNEVRTTVREHKETINRLNKDIAFYKGLMAPTEREKGLGIRSWEVYPARAKGRFQYKLVLQQLALKHRILKGSVQVDIVGRRNGVEEILSLDILSDQVESKSIPLRFKYYQYLEGELIVPVGFEPRRVDIVARASSPKKVKVEKHYGWIVQKNGV